jgi:hypothetical protein
VELCRLRFVNAELHNRDVSFGEHMMEHRPCAVI